MGQMIELTLIAEMVLVAVFICGLYELRGRFGLTPLYIGEVVTVIAFGIGWLAQGIDLWKWLRQST